MPKPKKLPEPIVIPKLKINSSVPKTIYKMNLNELENERKRKLDEKREVSKILFIINFLTFGMDTLRVRKRNMPKRLYSTSKHLKDPRI